MMPSLEVLILTEATSNRGDAAGCCRACAYGAPRMAAVATTSLVIIGCREAKRVMRTYAQQKRLKSERMLRQRCTQMPPGERNARSGFQVFLERQCTALVSEFDEDVD